MRRVGDLDCREGVAVRVSVVDQDARSSHVQRRVGVGAVGVIHRHRCRSHRGVSDGSIASGAGFPGEPHFIGGRLPVAIKAGRTVKHRGCVASDVAPCDTLIYREKRIAGVFCPIYSVGGGCIANTLLRSAFHDAPRVPQAPGAFALLDHSSMAGVVAVPVAGVSVRQDWRVSIPRPMVSV